MTRATALHATTMNFANYVPALSVRSSGGKSWRSLLLQRFVKPALALPHLLPSIPDPYLVLQMSGSLQLEEREPGRSWQKYRSVAGENDLFLVPAESSPYELRWQGDSDMPIEAIHLYLDADLVRWVANEAGLPSSASPFVAASATVDPVVRHLVLALTQVLEHEDTVDQLYLETAATFLSHHLLRNYRASIPAKHYTLSSSQLDRVTAYIRAQLGEDLSLAELARVSGLSHYHFARAFRERTGVSPHQYVMQQRIVEAKQRLAGSESLAQLALALGFSSQSHFTQVFKRFTGQTPSKFLAP